MYFNDTSANNLSSLNFSPYTHILIPDSPELNPTDITIAFWTKVNSNSYYNQFVNKSDGINKQYIISTNTTGIYVYIGNTSHQSNVLPQINVWEHIAFTYSSISGEGKIYLNGSVIHTFQSAPIISSSIPLQIGGNSFVVNAVNSVDGKMDNVQLWQTVLTENEIKQYINCPPFGNEINLIGFWNFDEVSGNTVFDKTLYANNGTITGATYNTNVPTQSCELTNVNGCDSTAVLNLTINPSTTSSISVSECYDYTWNGITYYLSGVYTFDTISFNGCDSTATLNLTINTTTTSSYSVTECHDYTWNGQTYIVSGAYTYTTFNVNGCDSVATLNLTINPSTGSTLSVVSCGSFLWNGTNYNQSVMFTYSTTNINGCDSTATLNLTINNPTTSSTSVTECDDYTWNGQTYTTSGVYTFLDINSNGCDSIATLNLTINPSTTSTVSVAECDNYTWNGQTYSSSGVYTFTIDNPNGCDSIVELNLTIYPSTSSTTVQTECNSYTWNGQLYDSSGTYYSNLSSSDSLSLSFDGYNDNIYFGNPTELKISGELTYMAWVKANQFTGTPGIMGRGEGTFGPARSASFLMINLNGYVLFELSDGVTIYEQFSSNTSLQLDSMYHIAATWDGTNDSNGVKIYINGVLDYSGTTSVSSINNNILNSADDQFKIGVRDIIAPGIQHGHIDGEIDEPQVWNVALSQTDIQKNMNCAPLANEIGLVGYWNFEEGNGLIVYDQTSYGNDGIINGATYIDDIPVQSCGFTNANGCDSTAILILTINYSTTSIEYATECDTYTWNGQTYTTSGVYTFADTNSIGCDSIATLNLTIIPLTTSSELTTECDDYVWNGQTYIESGVYTFTLPNSNGCDSIATLNLIIIPSTTDTTDITECNTYFWNGNTYNSSGTYDFTTSNANGCDSIAILNLTIDNIFSTTNTKSICFGDSIIIGNTSYSQSGTYTNVFTSVNGCDSIITTILNVSLQINVLITQIGNDIKANISGGSIPYLYEWNTGETSQIISPIINGDYWIIVTDGSECISDTSFFKVDWISTHTYVEDYNIDRLIIYPNPSKDIFNIEFISSLRQNLDIKIINSIGETIYIENLQNYYGDYNKSLNLDDYPKAIYFLEITTNDGIINKKLVLQ